VVISVVYLLVRLGHRVAASTVWQILHDAGIGPAPRRSGPTWKQFLTVQARGILAADFVHVDTVLLRRVYALIVIEHGTRRAHLVGITANPDGSWTTQAARNLLIDLGHRAAKVKFLIRDRAGQFTSSLDAVLAAEGIRVLASPPQAPRANAICERVIGTLRRELLDRLMIVNEHHLRQVLAEYLLHYNTARPHRSLGQLTPDQAHSRPPAPVNLAEHWIRRKQVLGGLTHEYYAALPPSSATENAGNGPNRISESHKLLGVAAVPETVEVGPFQIVATSKTLHGHPSGTAKDTEETLKFAALSGISPMTEERPLEEISEGYKRMLSGEANFRVVLTTDKYGQVSAGITSRTVFIAVAPSSICLSWPAASPRPAAPSSLGAGGPICKIAGEGFAAVQIDVTARPSPSCAH
jgi:hypothetical protein